MKKGLLYLGMMAVCMVFSINIVKAQTAGEAVTYVLPEMKLLAITVGAPTLTFVAPTIGTIIGDATSANSYLQYTSIVDGVLTNKIKVGITGTVPPGTTLTVQATAPVSANGNGDRGLASAAVPLHEAGDHDLITAIGSCYTGTGATDGANLTYTWSVIPGSFNLLNASPTGISILYTITGE